jgi:DnaJ-class molecular chaperone
MTDPYSVLGVPHSATLAEITHAYRHRLRDQHPDTRIIQQSNPSSAHSNSAADEQLRQILAAYALLRDPEQRAAYDRNHPAPEHTELARQTTTPVETNDRPPLWAGPVRWHRYR